MRTRLAVLPAVGLAAVLVGCSSSDEPSTTSAPAETSAAAPSSPTEEPTSSAAKATESATGESSSSAAPSSSSATSAESGGGGDTTFGATVSEAEIPAMAEALGCKNPDDEEVAPGSPGAKAGAKGGVQCEANSNGYLLIRTSDGKVEPVASSMKKGFETDSLPYLHGDNWILVGTDDPDGKTPSFPKSVLEDAKKALGAGEISTI